MLHFLPSLTVQLLIRGKYLRAFNTVKPITMPQPSLRMECKLAMPYAATPSEMKRRWVQTADGVYVSPELERDERGEIMVNVDWPTSLDTAGSVSQKTGRTYFVASYGEALDAIRGSKKAEQEARNYAEWTRNRYETANGRTVIFSHLDGKFEGVKLNHALKDGYIASLRLGAPDDVSDQPSPDFLNARLYYENNPVIRHWNGGFDAGADYRASDANGHLGFRLVWYERKEAEKILREQNKALRQEALDLRRKFATARKALG